MIFTTKNATTSENIKFMMTRRDMSSTDIAKSVGMSRQNFDNKLRRNNFCENELRQIAKALKFELILIFRETENNYGKG